MRRHFPSRWLLPATILGSALGYIDGSVVNVALPAIQHGLDANLSTVQWMVNGYLLTLAAFILLGGSAGDRLGHKRIFLIGLAAFAVTSLLCGLAPSAPWLVAFRFIQGAAAALLTPASLALIGEGYSGRARGPALGIWAAAGAITTSLGPPLGGWLIDTVGWRAIFFINLPIASVAFWLGMKLPAGRIAHAQRRLDLPGAIFAVIALGLLAYGLIILGEGRRISGLVSVTAAVIATIVFIRIEQTAREPMMPLSLFHERRFAAVNALTVLLYAALGGAMFLLPFLLIEVRHYSTAAAGSALLPFAIIMGVGSKWAGALVERIGPRLPLMLGPAITAVGYATLALSDTSLGYWIAIVPGICLIGIGMTLSIAPLTTTVFDYAPRDKAGIASGINNAAARAGALLAVAALGLVFGGTDAGALNADSIPDGYRLTMLAASGLALLSVVTCALGIRSR